ncbi:hypothetical protein [uncultured Tateyamaria sp.]|uniref:hypothetical protein n=1 Tax=Tateyamaria sp. 1078 TaxID=3417464 RepID=UPI0026322830|nr:hypothetical protein [uncultured Tateyamaria sp.]
MNALNTALLDAHARDDRTALVALYQQAAEGAQDDARGFFLTQAYVFALETGHPDCAALRASLVAMGREAPG